MSCQSLESFLQAWRSCSGSPASTSAAHPELCTPPKASFRPHEIVPRVYLGGIRDVANVYQLLREVEKESLRRSQEELKRFHNGVNDEHGASPPRLRSHRVVLLISLCNEITGAAPAQPQASSALPPNNTATIPVLSLSEALSTCNVQLELRRAYGAQDKVMADIPSPSQPAGKSHPQRSQLVESHTLAELEAQRCQEEGQLPAGSGDEEAEEAAVRWWQRRLMNHLQDAESQRDAAAEVSVAKTPLEAPADHVSFPQRPRRHAFYWRLLVPIADAPETQIRPFFRIVSTLSRAVLDARVPDAEESTSSREEEEAAAAAALENKKMAVPVSLSCAPMRMPCVVFHCMAGRSRSGAFVMAFLLDEWRRACRACRRCPGGQPEKEVPADTWFMSTTSTAARSEEEARSCVHLLLRFVQARRPVVCPNEGFCAALEQEAEALLVHMRKDSLTQLCPL